MSGGTKKAGGKAMQFLGLLVIVGFAVALLRAFDWDPFGVIDWIINWVITIITAISDWFGGNQYFQAFTDKR